MDLWVNRTWGPMLLHEVDKPFDSSDYIFEIKFDGIRAIMYVSPNEFQIISRNNRDMTNIYPELKSIQKLVKKKTILDGEIVSMDNGKPSFSKLQERNHLKNESSIKSASKTNPVVFVCFDVLYENGSLIDLKLIDRKKYLDKLGENDQLIKSKYISEEGNKLFKSVCKMNLEGIVAKEKSSKYEINTRTWSWLKIKNLNVGEFIIGGYEAKKNGISLAIGEYINHKLNYVGNVSLRENNKLYDKVIKSKIRKTSPFSDYKNDNINYIIPHITCNVKYLERTKNNHLRQPIIIK